MSIAVTTKEGDLRGDGRGSPGAEKEEDLVTITYASDVTFEILTIGYGGLQKYHQEKKGYR